MALLDEFEFKQTLALALEKVSSSITIFSAFVTSPGVEWIAKRLGEKASEVSVTIVSRWKFEDLVSGASDVNVFKVCAKYGWELRVDQALHSKVYLIDDTALFVGSANLTGKGLGIVRSGNKELTVMVSPEEVDLHRISEYTKSCVLIEKELYEEMQLVLDSTGCVREDKVRIVGWPERLRERLNPEVRHLWVQDLLFSSPQQLTITTGADDPAVNHDRELLGLFGDESTENIRQFVVQSRAYLWLKHALRKEGGEARFGRLTALLHESVMDDPKPYRREIKDFVRLLFDWALWASPDEFEVEQFRRTSVLKLIR